MCVCVCVCVCVPRVHSWPRVRLTDICCSFALLFNPLDFWILQVGRVVASNEAERAKELAPSKDGTALLFSKSSLPADDEPEKPTPPEAARSPEAPAPSVLSRPSQLRRRIRSFALFCTARPCAVAVCLSTLRQS